MRLQRPKISLTTPSALEVPIRLYCLQMKLPQFGAVRMAACGPLELSG
jgi:hypothetical protein